MIAWLYHHGGPRTGDGMRWAPVDRPGEAAILPVDEPPGADRRRPP